MRRREVLTLLGGTVSWPLAARAQQPVMPVVGYFSSLLPVPSGARAMGLQVQVLNADTSSEIDAAFARLAREQCDALLVDSIPFFTSRRVQLVNLASRLAVPAIYFNRAFAAIGGLMSYGASLMDAYRQVGVYAARILKGTMPADLPVVQSSKFELVINHQTARMLGLTMPPTLLARADEVEILEATAPLFPSAAGRHVAMKARRRSRRSSRAASHTIDCRVMI